jgi:hypothetical protein
MMNATTPKEMRRMAESLMDMAKGLLQSANALEGIGTQVTARSSGISQIITTAPTVKQAAILALYNAGKPVHIGEIYQSVKRQGAQLKDKGNLSSMLSKDNGETFQITPGMRGYWQLAPMAIGKIEKALKSDTSTDKGA